MLLTRATTAALLACLLIRPGWAQDEAAPPAGENAPEAGEDRELGFVELHFGFYNNGDGGSDGNPFLDEEETVIEPVIVLGANVTETVSLTLTGTLDVVTSASIERLSNFPEQSGASTDTYYSGDLAVSWQAGENLSLGVHAGGSGEYDYTSLGFGGDVAVDLFEKNTTLSFGLNTYVDSVKVIRWNGAQNEGNEDRLSVTVNLGYYQILAPTVHMSVGYAFTYQDGFLETAFNSVVLEDGSDPPNPNLDNNARGVEVTEELPDTRIRHALFGEVRKYFHSTGSSLALWVRAYTDDWGINSGTGELRYYQWIVRDVFRIRARYRFYVQTAADDFEDHFFVPAAQRAQFVLSEERTQDSDLAAFTSHTLGLQFTWNVHPDHAITLGGDYVLRSDGIDQILGTIGYRWDF